MGQYDPLQSWWLKCSSPFTSHSHSLLRRFRSSVGASHFLVQTWPFVHGHSSYSTEFTVSMDWFKGKSTGNHRFFHNMGLSCKFSLTNPLTWVLHQQVPQGHCRFRIPWVGSDLHGPSHAGVREPVTFTGLGGASKAGPRVCLLT